MSFLRVFTVLSSLLTVTFALEAHAQRLRLEVTGADFRPFPVAAPAVVAEGDVPPKLLRSLTEALQTGIELVRPLELVPPKSYIASPNEPWTAPKFADWVNVGASGLVRVQVRGKGQSMQLGCRFYDVVSQRELMSESYATSPTDAERQVHRCIDGVVKLLTGDDGILSSRIVVVKRTKGGKAVFMMNMDGSGQRRLTDPGELSLLPAWDHAGRFVMYTAYGKDNPDLYRLRLSDGQVEWLSKKRGLNTGAATSPDGKRIALTLSVDGNTEIYVMDWNGDNLKRLTDSWGQDVSATWSPDGNRIAFVSSRSGQPHIYVMDADGRNQRRLTFQGTYNQEPCWSPRADGEIVFTARDERLVFDIFKVHPDTGEITRLTQDEGTRNESPSFSPDGQQIVFTSNRGAGGDRKLFIMDVDGRNQRMIAKGGDFETPKWGPRAGW